MKDKQTLEVANKIFMNIFERKGLKIENIILYEKIFVIKFEASLQ